MRKMLIAGNWKMNLDAFGSEKLIKLIAGQLMKRPKADLDILVCPAYINIPEVSKTTRVNNIALGAQNCHYENAGAFTGETSIEMLKYYNCEYIIIGHSERRALFGEDHKLINNKLHAILESGMKPILCIGETLKERESGKTFEVLSEQLLQGMDRVHKNTVDNVVIAYEPVWAIGTGVSASVEQVNEAHNWLREFLLANLGFKAENLRILYGGSMKPSNAKELLSLENVDGGLIGGASLNADSFVSIVDAALEIMF